MALFRSSSSNGGGGAPTIEQLTYNANKRLLGSITTYGGSYTATEDCVMYGYGKATSGSTSGAYLSANSASSDIFIMSAGTTNAFYIGSNSTPGTNPTGMGMFIPKGVTVYARALSNQTFNLKFYSLD